MNTKLYQDAILTLLLAVFNQEELKTVCFKLGIEYEDLSGDNRQSKARELIKYLQKHMRIDELKQIVQKTRPKAEWPAETDFVVTDFSTTGYIKRYVEQLKYEASALTFPGIPLTPYGISPTLEDIYVPQLLYDTKSRDGYKAFLNEKRLLIEDNAGLGKSTLLKRVCIELCDRFLAGKQKQVPIKFDAQAIQPGNLQKLEDWLAQTLSDHIEVNHEELKQVFGSQGIFLLVDGLDEASKEQRNNFHKMVQSSELFRAGSRSQILVATRRLTSLGLNSFREPLGISQFSVYEAFRLAKQWEDYFRVTRDESDLGLDSLKWLREKINKYAGKEADASELIKIPLYLTYIIFLAATPGISNKVIDDILDSKILLYKRIIEELIPTWEDSKNRKNILKIGSDQLPWLEVFRILYAIAFFLQENRNLSRIALMERLQSMAQGQDYLSATTPSMRDLGFQYWLSSSVLNVQENNGQVRFWHREMQEYGAAYYLAQRYGLRGIGMKNDLREKLLDDEDWQNVRYLYSAISRAEEYGT